MKKLLVFLLGLGLVFGACNCSYSVTHTPSEATINQSFKRQYGPRSGRRTANKALTNYMSIRTVSVKHDCSPKETVVVVGAGNAERRHDGRGTGIIVRSYDNKSYVFTAAHVVTISKHRERKWFRCKITVQKHADSGGGDNKHSATILVKNDHRDIAVLEVDGDLGLNTELELNPFTGEDVWAVGYPVQMASRRSILLSITKGTLATKSVPVAGNSRSNGYYHRVTSQVYFGNSGGGIWTKEGKLLGIVVALFAGDRKVPYEGYYYAKPINEVLNMLLEKKKYEKVFRD